MNNDVVLSVCNEVALGVVAEPVEEADKGADKEKIGSGAVEVALGVVVEPVEEADKGAAKDKMAEAVTEYGEENDVEKGKSEYIPQSVWTDKALTVCGFYSERTAAAKHQQQNSVQSKHLKKVSPKKTTESSTRKRCRSRSSSSSSSSSSDVSSSVSISLLDVKMCF
jgi:hypothetical protein